MLEAPFIPNVRKNVPLAPYTTYNIGGPAEWFVEVASADELGNAVRRAQEAHLPYFVLGTGANVLIKDNGFRGLVIHNRAGRFEFLNSNRLRAESGATIAELIFACRDRGLSGLEHFVGIPSSVGGALWQNLHFLAPDRTHTLFIGDILESAEILDEQLETKTVTKEFFQFGYDDSILHHRPLVVLTATFRLTPKRPEEITRQMEENMQWRRAKQPQLEDYPSCGSVFKKIEGVGAGRLIEQAGLKGTRVGKIQVSEQHANYLVNLGGGTAAEVLALIKLIQERVKQKTGYLLEPEITVIGD